MSGTGRHALLAARLALVSWAVGAALTAPPVAAQNALAGRWQLDVARTHYGGGARPRARETFTCTHRRGTVTCTIHSVWRDGSTQTAEFHARDDGTDGPVSGMADVNRVRLVSVDTSITDATFFRDTIPVLAYRAVRSSDGRSLTIVSVDPVSRAVLHSVVVYEAAR